MSDLFYSAFEEKYRGSRELIKSRLQVYLPFVLPVFKAFPQGLALDVGCGRGEWLELLTEHGLNAKGVDLDDGMLQACRDRGLQVETADALAYIQALPEASLCVVSGFHFAEHLPFDVLQQLVQEAKRVLVPGGLLILETPNPENISVGSNSFYLDPTHERPIPPDLLSFLPEHYGYARFKLLRLQEDLQLRDSPNPQLINLLNDVSPDYGVVAQTQGVPLLMEALLPAFEQSFGLTLHTLAERYQASLDTRLALIEAKAEQAEAKAEQAEAKAEQAQVLVSSHIQTIQDKDAQLAAVRQQLHEVHQSNHHHWQLAEQRQQLINALNNSTSWRITAPPRWPVHQLRLLRQHGVKSRVKALAKKVLKQLLPFLLARPTLRTLATRLAHRLGIADRLKHFVRSCLVISPPINGTNDDYCISSNPITDFANLSPRARQIYIDLKLAIEQKKG